jgi:hypothetical protein
MDTADDLVAAEGLVRPDLVLAGPTPAPDGTAAVEVIRRDVMVDALNWRWVTWFARLSRDGNVVSEVCLDDRVNELIGGDVDVTWVSDGSAALVVSTSRTRTRNSWTVASPILCEIGVGATVVRRREANDNSGGL